MQKNWGWYLVIGTTVVPVILWSVADPLSSRISSLSTLFLSVGQLCALIGAALFSWNFILAARYRVLEGGFGGLNRVYVAHHIIGGFAFIFLLLHPVFIFAQYAAISPQLAAEQLIDPTNLPRALGTLAMFILIVTLGITYYIPLKHHVWKVTHQLIGLALLAGFAHVFFIRSTVATNMPLRYWMLALLLAALLSYLYRVVFGRYAVARWKYRVSDIIRYPGGIKEIKMRPEVRTMQYHPGQFVFMSIEQEGISREFHPFSLTSNPELEEISVGVKALGDYTSALDTLEKGAAVKIEGPFGRFIAQKNNYQDQIWIAGGIGITPFLSMIRSRSKDATGDIWLFYSVKSMNEAVFLPELMKLAKTNPDFSLFLQETERDGYLDGDIINEAVGELAQKEVFLCGPQPMMISLREQLQARGVEYNRIHTEEFSL